MTYRLSINHRIMKIAGPVVHDQDPFPRTDLFQKRKFIEEIAIVYTRRPRDSLHCTPDGAPPSCCLLPHKVRPWACIECTKSDGVSFSRKPGAGKPDQIRSDSRPSASAHSPDPRHSFLRSTGLAIPPPPPPRSKILPPADPRKEILADLRETMDGIYTHSDRFLHPRKKRQGKVRQGKG